MHVVSQTGTVDLIGRSAATVHITRTGRRESFHLSKAFPWAHADVVTELGRLERDSVCARVCLAVLFDTILLPRGFLREPLHVIRRVRSPAKQGHDMIDDPRA